MKLLPYTKSKASLQNKLPPGEYICEVLGGSNDPMKRGAVLVKVLGVTDDFKDEEQPYVYPAITNGIRQVPQKGYFLRVRFKNGDINCGKYYGMSQTSHMELPPEYVSNYPDTAVANCGEDGFFYTHDRMRHVTTIVNPGNKCTCIWDAQGFFTMECADAHAQAGMGGKEGKGANLQHVLTESTIDIFTCMPVGHNRNASGIGQGSEYLSVSHIAESTIEAFRGSTTVGTSSATGDSEMPSLDPTPENDMPSKELVGIHGEPVRSIQFNETEHKIPRTNKVIKRIIVCFSQGSDFPTKAEAFAKTNSCAHYLIGKKDGVPEIASEKSPLENTGFVQFVDITDDAGMFGSDKYKGEKANIDAVSIMLIGTNDEGPTDEQMELLNIVINHVRNQSGDDGLPILTPDDFDSTSIMFSASSIKKKLT